MRVRQRHHTLQAAAAVVINQLLLQAGSRCSPPRAAAVPLIVNTPTSLHGRTGAAAQSLNLVRSHLAYANVSLSQS